MNHTASAKFWRCYESLPFEVRILADKHFELLQSDPSHPSLEFKRLGGGRFYSARIGLRERALGLARDDGVHSVWVGAHAEHDRVGDPSPLVQTLLSQLNGVCRSRSLRRKSRAGALVPRNRDFLRSRWSCWMAVVCAWAVRDLRMGCLWFKRSK